MPRPIKKLQVKRRVYSTDVDDSDDDCPPGSKLRLSTSTSLEPSPPSSSSGVHSSPPTSSSSPVIVEEEDILPNLEECDNYEPISIQLPTPPTQPETVPEENSIVKNLRPRSDNSNSDQQVPQAKVKSVPQSQGAEKMRPSRAPSASRTSMPYSSKNTSASADKSSPKSFRDQLQSHPQTTRPSKTSIPCPNNQDAAKLKDSYESLSKHLDSLIQNQTYFIQAVREGFHDLQAINQQLAQPK